MESPNNIYRKHVFICTSGKTCSGQDADDLLAAMRKEIAELGLKKEIRINKTGCLDQCGNGPMLVIYPEGVWYSHVTAADAHEIVESHLLGDKPVERLLYDGRGKVV